MASRQRKNNKMQPKKSRVPARRRQWGRALRFEPMEARHLLAGFLQGYAFIDNNNDNIFNTGDAPKVNATIELRNFDGSVLLGTDVTDADGYYRFDNTNINLPLGDLTTGTYRLVETISPPGYASAGTEIQDILSDASQLAANTIQVNFTAFDDPLWTAPGDPLTINRLPGLPGVVSNYFVTGGPFNFATVIPNTTNAHQFELFLTGGALTTDPSPNFYSFCVDLFNANPATFTVSPNLLPDPPGLAANIGQIGYLYNTVGTQLLSPTDGTGLQLAIYELLYDTGPPNLFLGDFSIGVATDAGAIAAANSYLAMAAGKDQRAVFLGVFPPGQGSLGRQGMLVTEKFNFSNRQVQAQPELRILIAPDDTNAVGVPHTFTVTVQQDDGMVANAPGGDAATGFGPAAGAVVTVTLDGQNGVIPDVISPVDLLPGDPSVVGGVADALGQFQVTFTSAIAGLVVGNASATHTVTGTPLTRDTDPATATVAGPGGSGPATKRFVDAKIEITPNDTNAVGVDHIFTTVVMVDDGLTAAQGGDGVTGFRAATNTEVQDIQVTLVGSNGANPVISSPADPELDDIVNSGDNNFAVTFASATAGLVTGTAVSTVIVDGQSIVVQTNGVGNNSGAAVKRYVDAKVSITPDDVNAVGVDHTFTTVVMVDDGLTAAQGGDGVTGFRNATNAEVNTITVTLAGSNGANPVISNPADPELDDIVSSGNNSFAVTFASATAGLVTGTATSSVTIDGQTIIVSTNGVGNNSGAAVKRYVDAKISITPNDVNAVGVSHIFTTVVMVDDGLTAAQGGDGVTGFRNATDGEVQNVTVTLVGSNGANPVISNPADPELDDIVSSGNNNFAVTFASATAGLVTGTATSTVIVDGQSINLSTNGVGNNTGAAVKRYVDAKISITPNDVNEVGQPHTFTTVVMVDDGFTAAQGGDGVTGFRNATDAEVQNITVTLASSNGANPVISSPADPELDDIVSSGNNNFGVTFASATAGLVTGTATSAVIVDGQSINVSTNGVGNNSGGAVKRFVDGRITIGPDATNNINDPHTFTVTVQQDDGLTAAQGGDGVTGFANVVGTNVTVTLANQGGAGATPAGPFIGPTNAAGQFHVTFTSATPGQVIGNASSTFTVGGVSLTRDTNPSTATIPAGPGGSGPATKTFVRPGIKMKKYTNGIDADNEHEGPEIAPGDVVTWTYIVENTGQTNFTANQIVIVDDAGTPGVPGDDFGTAGGNGTNSAITFQLVVSGDADNILEPGEKWQYKATGIAQDLGSSSGGPAATFDFSGTSALDGTDGNIRTFTSGSLSVKASAFSRDAGGVWSTAFLGSYSGGLGVTDSGEGTGANNTHTVDNLDRDNYVLFEFSDIVAIDSAFLGYVVDDSDLRIWIGTKTDPFNNHQILSDAFLTSLGFTELNETTLTTTRLADLNAAGITGNVIVIAANPDEPVGSQEDNFKIEKLTTQAVEEVCYENYAVVTTGPGGPTSTDLSHYCNPEGVPDIKIIKYTNGVDANTADQAAEVNAGDVVTWTYEVKNTGTLAFTAGQISITDDAGTPGVGTDDFGTSGGNGSNSAITFQSVLVGDADNLLEPGESWLYKATGIAQDLLTTGSVNQFNFSGTSATDGTDGNIRTFTAGSVSVKASAFSRDKASGAWANAFLGSYSGGLGVTDSSEGSGANNTHTVDNNSTRDNYVLFEFNQTVVVDSAFLGYVFGDSDITVWIGSSVDPFNNHLVLSDAIIAGLGFTEVNTGGNAARSANLNAGSVAGNVLVIAAKKGEADDYFKIEKLDVRKLEMGVYKNIGKVVADGVSDTDPSHYKNADCIEVTYNFSGSTAVSGAAGNVKTYTVNGVSVNVRAFSRTTAGAWNAAYLGAYSDGLGVTDGSEDGNNGTHRVDNIGRWNFVVFEFSTLVEFDRAYLNSVVGDSDIDIWVGTSTNPFHNPITPSDAGASMMTLFETSEGGSSARWADVNSGGVYGNVVVIAAAITANDYDDQFKIEKMEVCAKAVKFYTVDSGTDDTFEYGPNGQALANYNLHQYNTNLRGVTTTAAGNKVWVIDGSKIVYVYDQDGKSLGSWTANGLTTPEDIATNGTDIWILDDGANKIFRYSTVSSITAANRTSGAIAAASSFALNSANADGKGLVTDGNYIWVVNDAASGADKVFKYNMSGALQGSWTIDAANGSPTGIALNPADVEHLWISDIADNAVYRYNGAAAFTSGTKTAADVFQLAGGNGDVQGIADPPPGGAGIDWSLASTGTTRAFAMPLEMPMGSRNRVLATPAESRLSLADRGSRVLSSQADRLMDVMSDFAPVLSAASQDHDWFADSLHGTQASTGCEATDAVFSDFEAASIGDNAVAAAIAKRLVRRS